MHNLFIPEFVSQLLIPVKHHRVFPMHFIILYLCSSSFTVRTMAPSNSNISIHLFSPTIHEQLLESCETHSMVDKPTRRAQVLFVVLSAFRLRVHTLKVELALHFHGLPTYRFNQPRV